MDAYGKFSLSDGSGFGKNVITFVADMSSSVHTDNKKKYILVLGKGSIDGLKDTTLNLVPRAILKKIALAPHDFVENFYLILSVSCKKIKINLCSAVNSP